MANKRKILEAARKLAQKGAKEKALKEYEKLLNLDPKDARLRIEIGDAYRRWGQVEDAISIYSKLSQQYMLDGFDARAVAVFKQIHNLDPEHWASYEPLGELYQRMGLTAEAINTLQTAADGQHRSGNKREALDLLRKMATLDPSNTMSRLKVADLLRQEGLNQEAIAEYEEVVAELNRQGEHDSVGQALERILELEPNHATVLVQMVDNLIARGLFDHAEAFAKRCIECTPEVPEHYERLAQVYRGQHRDDALEDVYRRLAEVYRQRGDDDRARDIIQRFVASEGFEVTPDTAVDLTDDEILDNDLSGDVSEFLADADLDQETLLEEEFIPADDSSPAGAPMRVAVAEQTVLSGALGASADPGPELDLEEIADLDDLVDSDSAPGREPAAELAANEATSGAFPEGDPDQLLAEACVYLRYGKRVQAIANLQGVLLADPGHRAALEKLGEAHAEGGESELAIAQWLSAAERAREDGDHAAVEVLRDRIAAIDEAAAQALASTAGASAPEIDLGLPDSQSDESDISAEETPSDDFELDNIEIEVDDSELDDIGLDEELDLGDAAVGVAQDPLTLQQDVGPSDSDLGNSASLSQQIGEELEEADFYIQQGLHDEAEAIYKRVLEAAPNHTQAMVRLGEIAAARGDDPASTASGLGFATSEPEELLDVPDLSEVEREPAEMPGERLDDVPEDLNDWTDGFSDVEGDELDLDGIDPQEVVAADMQVDPNAETDLDLEESLDKAAEPVAIAADATSEPQKADEAALLLAPQDEDLAAVDLDLAFESDFESASESEDEDEPVDELLAAPPPVAADPGLEAGFDLAAELNEAFDADTKGASASGTWAGADDGFAAVFQEFKKGVQNTLSDGDHQAHYDLGIAYREMGLLDDAMGEFRAAMGDAERRLDCLQMLGLCSLERDSGEEAVAHFEQALAQEGINSSQQLALRFELGRAFENLGNVEAAREAWQAVAAADANFCEVGDLLAALDTLEKPEDLPAVDEDTAASESFESFEDLIGEEDDDDSSAAGHVDFDDLVSEANAEGDDDDASDDDAMDDEETDDAQSHEDFQDLVSEMSAELEDVEAEDEAIVGPGAELAPIDEIPLADAEEETASAQPAEASAEPAPEAQVEVEPEAEAEPEQDPAPSRAARKKKKISFV